MPRFSPRSGISGVAINLAVLLLAGVLGAALLHLTAYHLRAGSTGAYLLAHCPWRLVLLIILSAALFNALVFWRELGRLVRERGRLAAPTQAQMHPVQLPRRPARLAGLFIVLYAIGSSATTVAMQIAPMRAPMIMDGHSMIMTVTPIFPLSLGQLVITALLALLLWRCERSLNVLRQIISALRTLLAAPILRILPQAIAGCRAPRLLYGFSIFARPPPVRCWS
jgi:hypothetical protein